MIISRHTAVLKESSLSGGIIFTLPGFYGHRENSHPSTGGVDDKTSVTALFDLVLRVCLQGHALVRLRKFTLDVRLRRMRKLEKSECNLVIYYVTKSASYLVRLPPNHWRKVYIHHGMISVIIVCGGSE